MYCPDCGVAGQEGRHCAECGSRLPTVRGGPRCAGTNSAVYRRAGPVSPAAGGEGPGKWYATTPAIVLLLVFFFPAGLLLMWKYATWSEDTKWVVSGVYFWPLWMHFVWRQPWGYWRKVAAGTLLVCAYASMATTRVSGFGLLIAVTAFVWALTVRDPGRTISGPKKQDWRDLEARLSLCDDLVASIESSVALRLLPAGSPVLSQYVHGLDARREAIDLMDRGGESDPAVARQKLAAAWHDLHAVSSSLAAEP